MGKMKEEFMKDLDRIKEKHHPNHWDEDYDVEEFTRQMEEQEFKNLTTKEYINQQNQNQMSNNLNKIKMKKVKSSKEVKEPVVETRKDILNRLFKENNLSKEDVYKDPRGFAVITRTGIDKIVSKNDITLAYEVINLDVEKGICVLRAAASMKIGDKVKNTMSFGEAAPNNLVGGGKKFPVAMAEKRAMSRVVLKIAGFYEQGVFGQDELDNE